MLLKVMKKRIRNFDENSKLNTFFNYSKKQTHIDLQWIVKLSTEEGYETNSQFFLDKKIEALVSLIFILLLLV